MPPKQKWLTVFHRAVYENVPDEVKVILDKNPEVGLPSPAAWMPRFEAVHDRQYECVMDVAEIASRHGFEDAGEWVQLSPTLQPAAIWIPQDEIDCKTIIRDLTTPEHQLDLDLTIRQQRHLESVLMGSLEDPSKAVYAVRFQDARKTIGVIAYERNLVFVGDTAQLILKIEGIYCGGYSTTKAALFAAFNEQTSTDLEGAMDSMGRAGVTPKLSCSLTGSDAQLHERLSKIIHAAKEQLFHVEEEFGIPHVGINLFGSWLSGSNQDDDSNILLREPTAVFPAESALVPLP
ncbi:hypothetical protein D3C71_157460 [compost metagenome]